MINVFDLFDASVLSTYPLLVQETLNSTKIELPNKNYILPNAIPMWPPVWWSWLVLLAMISLLVIALFIVVFKHKKNAYRREALVLLNTLQTQSSNITDAEFLTTCHQTIRRCLITRNRKDLASLASHELFATLDMSLKDSMKFEQLGEKFITGAYQPNLKLRLEDRENILNITKHWCRSHNA